MYLWITHLFVCIYVHLCLHIRHSISITYFSLSSHVAPVVKNQSANPLEEDVWQPTPVFLPGKFQGQRSLTGYSSLGCKRLDSGAMHICTHFSKITKKMEWPDCLPTVILIYHFSALSSLNKYNRKCQEATVRTGHGKTDWFQVGKGVHQSCILSPCLFNLYAEYIMWNARLDEAQAGIKITGRNINNLKYADDTTLMAQSTEELKSLLMKVKEEREKAGLKLNIQKTKNVAPGPITSWQIDGETMETGTDFIFLGFKITADGDCSHEIKRHLLLGRKTMINLNSILKSRNITLPTKVHLVKAMVFPIVMYGCEIWTIKAEH